MVERNTLDSTNPSPLGKLAAEMKGLEDSALGVDTSLNQTIIAEFMPNIVEVSQANAGATKTHSIIYTLGIDYWGGFGNACVAIRLAILEPRKAVRLTTTVTYAIYAGRVSIRHNRRPRAKHPPRSNTGLISDIWRGFRNVHL